jgi:hypothetical protein
MKILSIEAWANEDGWSWNSWSVVGDISKRDFEKLTTDKKVAVWMYDNDFTTTSDMRKILIEDDGHNVVLCEKKSRRPIYAIEYGNSY